MIIHILAVLELAASGCGSDPRCGNRVKEDGEQCDLTDFGASTCLTLGYSAGSLACNPTCMLDATGCATCGDGRATGTEPCDGPDLRDSTCESLGMGHGTLACDGCAFQTGGCARCGDGRTTGTEKCEDAELLGETCESLGFAGGELACSLDCEYDTRSCLPDNAGALSFDGVDDIVRCGALDLGLPLTDWTWEAWVTFGPTSDGTIFTKFTCECSAPIAARSMAFRAEPTAVVSDINFAGSPDQLGCGFALSDGVGVPAPSPGWHHVAFTWQSTGGAWKSLGFYWDGVLLSAGPFGIGDSDMMMASPLDILIGNADETCGEDPTGVEYLRPLLGTIDEIRFWSHARSETEIAMDRARTLAGTESGLEGYWPFDEGAGQVTREVVSGTWCVLGNAIEADDGDPAWTVDTPF